MLDINKNSSCSSCDSNDSTRSQICTCHDSSAVMACAKLWTDLISIFYIRAMHTFIRLDNEFMTYLWNGSQKSLTATNLTPQIFFLDVLMAMLANLFLSSSSLEETHHNGTLRKVVVIFNVFFFHVLMTDILSIFMCNHQFMPGDLSQKSQPFFFPSANKSLHEPKFIKPSSRCHMASPGFDTLYQWTQSLFVEAMYGAKPVYSLMLSCQLDL